MAIPANTLRFSIRGNLPGNEIWNSSIWLRPIGSATAPTNGVDCDTLLTALKGVSGWSTFRDAVLALIRSTAGIVEERLYSYPVSGTHASAVAVQSDIRAGTSTAGTLPNQCCCVMTLLTGVAGRSQRGRIYFPAGGLAISPTDGQFSSTQSGLRSGFAAWVLGTAGLVQGWAPYVVSQTQTSSLSVVQVKVDTRPDIQRRRANRQAATSAATTNTPWV